MAVRQLFRTATLFDADDREVLHGQLIYYARAVVEDEWQIMRKQRESAPVDGWLDEFEQTIRGIEPAMAKQDGGSADPADRLGRDPTHVNHVRRQPHPGRGI